MSQRSTTAINHALTTASAVSMVGRIPLFGGASLFALILVWVETLGSRGVHMNHEWLVSAKLDDAAIYAAFIVGILFALFLGYFFKYQYYKKEHGDALLQFDIKYIVVFLVSGIVAGAISYYIIWSGVDCFYTPTGVWEPFLAIVACFAIGAIVAYVVDALVFHPIIDGTVATLYNQKQKEIQQRAGDLAKDPAVEAKIRAKAQALGLTEESLVKRLCAVVSNENDPSFGNYVQNLKLEQK